MTDLERLAQSVHARLRNVAQQTGQPYHRILDRYVLERLLYRLGQSAHREQFVLKGAMLFVLWLDQAPRPTRDLDLLAYGSSEAAVLRRVFEELCGIDVKPDGLQFEPESVRVEPIREEQAYGGQRVRLAAGLGQARLLVQVDVGFGDVVAPPAVVAPFPTLLDQPAPMIRVYRRETVVAEKFHAMVELGARNSRMKGFFDLWLLAAQFSFEGPALVAAVRATFVRRGTPLPEVTPAMLTSMFLEDPALQARWRAFVRRLAMPEPPTQEMVLVMLQAFLLPLTQAGVSGQDLLQVWHPGGPWREADLR